MLTPIRAMVRKDLRLFLSDRRAVIMSFVAPIAIASFFGSIFSGTRARRAARRSRFAIVDEDRSADLQSRARGAQARQEPQGDDAGARRGARGRAARHDHGRRRHSRRASATRRTGHLRRLEPSRISTLWYDPSHGMELGLVRGVLAEHVMQAVSNEMFNGRRTRAIDDTLRSLDSAGISDVMPRPTQGAHRRPRAVNAADERHQAVDRPRRAARPADSRCRTP